MKTALLSIVFFLVSHWLVGQAFSSIFWQKALGGSSSEVANSIVRTTDGGYIVAGYTSSNDGDVSGNHGGIDFWVVKLSNIGTIEWQKSLGGSSSEVANSIVQTTDGGYIVAGHANSNDGDVSGNHGERDFWVVKLSNEGTIEWQKALGGTGSEEANSIVQTADGGYIVAGYATSNDGDVSGNHGLTDFWVVKLSNAGTIEWQKVLGGSSTEIAYSIIQTADGGYIVAGNANSNDGDVSGNLGSTDCWVIKLSYAGIIEWQKSLGGSSTEVAYSIIQTADAGYILTGHTYSNDGDVSGNHGNFDCWVVKLSNGGTIEWQKALGGSSNDFAYSITQVGNGYVIAGTTLSNNGDVSGNHGDYDFWVANFSIRNFTVSPNYPCQDKYVKLTSEGCAGTTRWYAYPEGETPALIHTGISYDYLVSNTLPLSTAVFFKAECTTTSGFVISLGSPKYVRVLGASSYDFMSPADDFSATPPYPLNVSNSITARNKISGVNTQVEYRAEKGIELKPGFGVDSGAVFTAYIGGCQ